MSPARWHFGRETGRVCALVTLSLLLLAVSIWSVGQGTTGIPVAEVLRAFTHFDGSWEHLVIMNVRLPRVLAGLLAGGALAAAGAIMQAVTANPLASPDLLGVNAGAALAVVVALSLFGVSSSAGHVLFAFAGAGATAIAVYLLGTSGRGGNVRIRLVLAGAILTTFLMALTVAVLIFDGATLDAVRQWTAGSLVNRSMAQVEAVLPFMLAGLALALLARRQITTLSLGPDAARGVGQNPALWLGLSLVIVILLAGGAVALAGPVGFVGLVVPHIVRVLNGTDYRWIIPFCITGGALLVVAADAGARIMLKGADLPVGIVVALLGAPFFLWLVRVRAQALA
ncbi:iron ABC transporter permease [Nisaea sp.]|uniref:FecCD family ABC transporter permease n=1 Tax=Nisaea sp. TaxID=2024842 RepID=UPI00326417B3